MLTIGLTGQSGAGKGVFCRGCIRVAGVFALDTDLVARSVVEKGSPALAELCEYFGDGILLSDGSLDRKKLAEIAFSDTEKHEKLNSITHFYIIQKIKEWVNEMRENDAKAVIIDAPLLFESGADALCDVTVAITAPYETRLSRIMERDGIDEKSARIRLDSQPDDDYYEEKCDYVILNVLGQEDLVLRAERLMAHLLAQ